MASVLVIYKEFPAPSVGHAGGKAVFHVIAFLHRQGHRVSLVARVREQEMQLIDETRPFCEHIYTVPHHTALPGPTPLAFLRSYLALRREARCALKTVQPDFVHVEVTQTALTILGLARPFTSFRPLDVNWFLFEQQAASARGVRRWGLELVSCLLHALELWICRRYDLIATISEGDRRLIAPHYTRKPLLLLPLSASFNIVDDVEPAVPSGPNVLFVGAMYRAFNVQGVLWFLDRVWPDVLARVPQARFYVVGYDPPPEILGRHDGEHVFIVGFAESLVPWYRSAAVSVSPLFVGGGLLQKVIDALSAGTPVVATSVSNHGVGAVPEVHLLLADEASDFAAAVVRLLQNPADRERLARAGQQFVNEQYDLDQALLNWESTWLGEIVDHQGGVP
ncbi:MAG: glycosyltransferase [Anaerolineae bacterium]|nr:glycosyltransferase [Anaerolineae bacterium]